MKDVTVNEASLSTSKDFEKLIIQLQARIRGYLTRTKANYFMEMVIKIQAWWRGELERRKFMKFLQKKIQEKKAQMNDYQGDELDYYRVNVNIIQIKKKKKTYLDIKKIFLNEF